MGSNQGGKNSLDPANLLNLMAHIPGKKEREEEDKFLESILAGGRSRGNPQDEEQSDSSGLGGLAINTSTAAAGKYAKKVSGGGKGLVGAAKAAPLLAGIHALKSGRH